jgi:hypothetical protein
MEVSGATFCAAEIVTLTGIGSIALLGSFLISDFTLKLSHQGE